MKLLFIFLTLFLFLPPSTFSQNKSGTTHVGVNFSTDYCYRKLKQEPSFEWIWSSREQNEQALIGFNSGITFLHKFANKISIEAGIQYIRLGEKIVDLPLFTGDGLESTNNKLVNNYDYIGVPLKFGYRFSVGERVNFIVGAGISTNVFFAYQFKTLVEWNDGTITKKRSTYFSQNLDFKRLNFAGILSVGLDFKITNSVLLRAEPTFRYSLNSITDFAIKQWPYSAGLNIGLIYQLGTK